MNRRFRAALEVAGKPSIELLDASLADVVKGGIIQQAGCFFLAAFARTSPDTPIEPFQDETGRECFLNHTHMSDYVQEHLFRQGLLYSRAVLELWNAGRLPGTLNSIISVDETDVVVRFHLKRPDQSWMSGDLEGFEQEGIAEISSEDMEFFAPM